MKTIKFLFVAAIVAGLTMSCEDNELMELINSHTPDPGMSSDTIHNPAYSDTTQNPVNSDTTQNPVFTDTVQNPTFTDPIQNFTYVSGTGEIASQTVNLANFTEVELKKIGEVEVLSGSEYKVEISDYENLLPYAKVYMEGERLIISYDSVQVMGSKLKISITIPDQLSKVVLSGSGNIFVNSGFVSDKVHLIVSGSGNISASGVNSQNVDIVMSGAGKIEAKGKTENFTLEVSGSATIQCKELISNNADCDLRGVSTVFVSVEDKLKVNAFVVGSLTYYGSPILEVEKGLLFSLIKG